MILFSLLEGVTGDGGRIAFPKLITLTGEPQGRVIKCVFLERKRANSDSASV
jgi:hypothetical protein